MFAMIKATVVSEIGTRLWSRRERQKTGGKEKTECGLHDDYLVMKAVAKARGQQVSITAAVATSA
ncbi:hypothetical protein L218DRAFT_105229 [Marasmius fiardii PR-910]|nr:hypothetical protein L218DRAFT_105229 [Marasmius fiardii PR-910]